MAKVGRNDPCPCGSGIKYKKCHGQLQTPGSSNPRFREEVGRRIAAAEAKQIQQQRQQGLGRPIISEEMNGNRIVAVRNTLHWSNKWKTFHDFLADYIKLVFGKEWWMSWVGKPQHDLHPVLLWAHLTYAHQCAALATAKEKGENRIRAMNATGAMAAHMSLAYDLYCLAHNVEIQTKLVERLKHPDQFWGARYEVFVAASLLRAGFDVEFEDEDDRTSSHCEFTATYRATGRKFSVEAKHRAGTQFRFGRQLNRALKKFANHERMVFIDVNMPTDGPQGDTPALLKRAINDVRPFEKQMIGGNRLPEAYLIITNSPDHHHLNSTAYAGGIALEGFRITDFKHDTPFSSLREAVDAKEKHRELHMLAESLRDHSSIPTTFDGEIPEFAFRDMPPRLLIGNLYEIPLDEGSAIGRLTSAVVNEQEQQVYGSYHIECANRSVIVTSPMTPDELAAWRRHPDTFFGVPERRTHEARDALEMYEFLMDTYSKTSREELLGFLSATEDFDQIRNLEQPQLAKEYCLRMATNIYAQAAASPKAT